jgi:hypothetical protein
MAILNNSNAISTAGGYDVNNSLRFRSSASAYLNRTPTVAGNQTTWTWSAWVKRGTLSSDQILFDSNPAGTTDTTRLLCYFSAADKIVIDGAAQTFRATNAVFRDPSAWYHIVISADTTNATADNRFKIYVNGIQQTMSTNNTFTQNANTAVNGVYPHYLGYFNGSILFFDGYMSDVYLVDGQALTPSSFGETDTTIGSWKPKAYTGTYGTNGFYLKFSDIATTSGSNAGLGKDFSGNTNYWTTNNISVTAGTTYDAMIDSPTLTSATVANYAVLNPLDTGANTTISDGNLKYVTSSNAAVGTCRGTFGVTSGKWYFEVTAGSTANANTVGIANANMNVTTGLGDNANGWGYSNDGYVYNNGSFTATGATWGSGDIAGIAFDADSGKLWFAKNNTWVLSGNPSAGTNPAFTGLTGNTFFPAVSDYGGGSTSNLVANFGQRPFSYTPPTGFVALNTYNLPDSTIKKGNTVMDATTYTGTGSTQSITNAGSFKPDLVWTKSRSNAYNNVLCDSVRGVAKGIFSDLTNAEDTASPTSYVQAFNSNGFSVNIGTNSNANGATYVGWQWQAGQGSTSSNTSGSITSTVSVNTTAGFSVVTYTGTGSTSTVGHGLGIAPRMIILKNRGIGTAGDGAWQVYHASIGNTQYLSLNTTAAAATSTARWNNTSPTSTVFTVATTGSVNDPSNTYVAYCWAEIAGFSRFGSYTGNGSTDGPFVFTGFRPKFFLVKRTDTVESWNIVDTSRNEFNQAGANLYPNLSNAESTNNSCDILSNGIKLRNTWAGANASGGTYIYMAFAENPFKNANAR